MEGKYFILTSKHCGLTLGIENNSNDKSGKALAVMCNRNEKQDHQIWFEEESSGTIRSKANDLCLTVVEGSKPEDSRIHLKPYSPNDRNQKWKVDGNVIRHREQKKVLDIKDGNKNCGAVLCSWEPHSGTNQLWDVCYLPPRYFYILSSNRKVLDVENANPNPGAKVILWDKKPGEHNNQLWYEDKKGCIRSKLNNFAFEASTNEVNMQPFSESNESRCWLIYGPTVFLKKSCDVVLDVDGGKVVVSKKSVKGEGRTERWSQEFVN